MINYLFWLSQPPEIRAKLAIALKIRKSTGVTLDGGRVVCDGHTAQDLLDAITVEKLQAFTESKESDIYKLFELAKNKVLYPTIEKAVEPPKEIIKPAKRKKNV